ncbi:MAG: hypothetical protein HYU41_11515 [Candidatus Rokubacteria bacterium]|nr:hypothetical protein [Candidatus Rokubacteria bacterium]
MERPFNHWKATAIGMGLVLVTAILTGLVVAGWYGPERPGPQSEIAPAASPAVELPARDAAKPLASEPAVKPTAQPTQTAQATSAPRAASSVPSKSVTDACNQYAARQAGSGPATTKDKTIEVVKDAAVGAVGGAAIGALGGAIADGGKGAGKGAAIGGIAGGGAGTLYGIYANRKNDEAYRTAYASCMKNRGFTSG